MEFITHRINIIDELKQVPFEYGVELDLRDYGDRLILQHDPFKDGEDFEEYLKHYNHRTMILNIKSERVEHGFKLCLVSPELQGQGKKLDEYKQYLQNEGIVFDAVCTKVYNVKKWKNN